jgi:hypothetical protein
MRRQRPGRPLFDRQGRARQRNADAGQAGRHGFGGQHFGVRIAAAAGQPAQHLVAQHAGGAGHQQARFGGAGGAHAHRGLQGLQRTAGGGAGENSDIRLC